MPAELREIAAYYAHCEECDDWWNKYGAEVQDGTLRREFTARRADLHDDTFNEVTAAEAVDRHNAQFHGRAESQPASAAAEGD